MFATTRLCFNDNVIVIIVKLYMVNKQRHAVFAFDDKWKCHAVFAFDDKWKCMKVLQKQHQGAVSMQPFGVQRWPKLTVVSKKCC